MPLDFNFLTLRRRTAELTKAAASEIDDASKGLLLFYAAECGLKAVYMSQNSLRLASETNGTAPKSAIDFQHRLDELIRELRISPAALPHHPGAITLTNGERISVQEVHQAWRYGGVIVETQQVLVWLKLAIEYAKERMR